ncbi:MAG TPA: DUF3343 domain-containing protein [Geobacteraceae bacterium]
MGMVKQGEYVAIFNSIHRVLKAEKLLKGRRFQILLIPVPRLLSSDCGLAIRYTDEERAVVEGALAEAGLLPEETYVRDGESYRKIS